MKAGDEHLGAVFNKDHRYVIPIFQRPYVWDELDNWIPLWNDIRHAAESAERQTEYETEQPAREHFLGAFVTQHRNPTPRRTPTSMVIDGQQRMTTLQVFLAAARRVAVECGALHAADSFAALVRNRISQDSQHPEDRFKIAPLTHDVAAFTWAMREPNDNSEPPDPQHKLVRAARWFDVTVREWAQEAPSISDRFDFLHFAIENRIKVVSIFLDARDDPQVIFEALNHRGVRLDAADLVKNLLFQTLTHQDDGHLEQELLTEYWSALDSGRWRKNVTTGRIKRVRADILLAYWLSAQRGEESSVEHLFEDVKRWMRTSQARAADVIKDIRLYADTMDHLQQLPMSSPIAQVVDHLEATNTTTPWPLILFLHASRDIPYEQAEIGTLALNSYLMRRAICRKTVKDYNRFLGSILGSLKSADTARAGDQLIKELTSQTAESRIWPDDATFTLELMNSHLYTDLTQAKLRALLVGIENHLHANTRTEPAEPHRIGRLTIEHVMPVAWQEGWPLSKFASEQEIEERNNSVHQLGNLTLATRNLNSSLSNQPWDKKRHALQTYSLFRLTNASILTRPTYADGYSHDEWVSTWDEDRIRIRGLALVRVALAAWPGPDREDAFASSAESVWPGDRPTRPSDRSAPTRPAPTEPIRVTPTRPSARTPGTRTRIVKSISGDLLPLLRQGLVVPGDMLRHRKHSGEEFTAIVTESGELDTARGRFRAPSPALSQLVGNSRNGWKDWTHVQTGKTLAELRDMVIGSSNQ